MRLVRRPMWTRRSEAGLHLELFLVAAVSSVLGIRWFLELTGYPKVGGGGLHIAHLLWGGFFMLVALFLVLTFLDRPVHRAAAVTGGLGFGVFIDEVGKFLTTDNDYFFRPAIALIYAIFIGLFLILRVVLSAPMLSARESLANAIHLSEEGVDGSISPGVRNRILGLLRAADPSNPLTGPFGEYVKSLDADRERTAVARSERYLTKEAERLVNNPWFDRALLLVVAAYAILAVASAVLVGVVAGGTARSDDVARVGETVSSLVGAALVLVGLVRWPEARAAGYRWFIRGVLVWILVTQIFVFYNSQLAGLGGLAFDLVAYVVLRSLLARELHRSERQAGGSAQPA